MKHKAHRFFASMLVAAFFASTPGMAAEIPNIPTPTEGWNTVWHEVLIDLWVIGILFGSLGAYFLVKYRAKDPDAVGSGKKLDFRQALAWCLIPCALFLADDFMLAAKGWTLWNTQRTIPAGSMEIKVTASQWNFTYEYPNGVEISSTDRDTDKNLFGTEIMDGDLVIPVGKPIVMRMISSDVIHSFGLTDYRLKEDIMPGRVTYIWFMARKPNISQVVCVEFCGTNHSGMYNRVVAVSKANYDTWLAKKKQEATLRRRTYAANIIKR
ncbi:MAG: cytochrome c oxidase subunit II [bacterium]|nr:cytochrome c oxidase subunit II [bacterium]